MSAFDDFLDRISLDKARNYREELVSNSGTFISGKLPESMSLSGRARNGATVDWRDSLNKSQELHGLCLGESSYSNRFGFVFNSQGTERAMEKISAGGKLKLYEDFRNNFLLHGEKEEIWNEAGDRIKKKLIQEDVREMIKKTEMQYRTHGDRMHYFVIGKVVTHEKNERKVYPLFLFTCVNMDRDNLAAEIEQTGFLNFRLDKDKLDGVVSRYLGGEEITIDDKLAEKLNSIKLKLNNLNSDAFDAMEFDPLFSMFGIIEGFETEYLDPAWKEILK